MTEDGPKSFQAHTECVTGFEKRRKMIIFESHLTTFGASIIFEATESLGKIGSSLNPRPS